MSQQLEESRARCRIGQPGSSGSWQWSIEVLTSVAGYTVRVIDGESAAAHELLNCDRPYTWQKFAGALGQWHDLIRAMRDEIDMEWIPGLPWRSLQVVGESGVVADVLRICLCGGDADLARWLAAQSDASIATLAEVLPKPFEGPRREILDEVVEAVSALEVPKDLLGVCSHYGGLKPDLGLATLRQRLAQDMSRQAEEQAVLLESHRAAIEALLRRFSDEPRRGAGMTLPSKRSILRKFVENYVRRRGRLPRGVHEVEWVGRVDFGESSAD